MDIFYDSRGTSCPLLCVTKSILFALLAVFILYLPLGDPAVKCTPECEGKVLGFCCICDIYRASIKVIGQRVRGRFRKHSIDDDEDSPEWTTRETQAEIEAFDALLSLLLSIWLYEVLDVPYIRIGNSVKELAEQLFCTLQNVLSELKYKFYGMLNAMDRNDLCRTISCTDNAEQTQEKQLNCKCSRPCCKKKSESKL